MDVKRCTKSFRSGGKGASVGDLLPAAHPLVERFPGMFEPVGDFVARRFPEYAPRRQERVTETEPKKAPAGRRPTGKK